jgi:caleosin-related protein
MGTGPTALQRHVAFFDPEGTGFVTMKQARAGLRRLGVPWIWRIVLPAIICGFLGDRTSRRPFVVSVPQIARGKHPFDTGVFDAAGDFDAAAFEVLFAGRDALTKAEMRAVIGARGDRRPRMGLFAGILGHWFSNREVQLFFCLGADTHKWVGGRAVPAARRETMQAFYDGTLLPRLARRRLLAESGCFCRRGRAAPGAANRSS